MLDLVGIYTIRIVGTTFIASLCSAWNYYGINGKWSWGAVAFGAVIGAIGGAFSGWLRFRQMNILSETMLCVSVIIAVALAPFPEKWLSLEGFAIALGVGIVSAILIYVTERWTRD